MSSVLTFDAIPAEGTINFGVGQPSADLLPVDVIQKATSEFFRVGHPLDLNYGPRSGDRGFRDSLAAFLTNNYGHRVDAEGLFVTGGNSQALELVCTHFSNPGDTIFVEEPCYFLALQIFADHGLNIVGVPVDNDGIDVDALETMLAKINPTLLYTIPSYQNPSGKVMSALRRQRLVELSQQHGFLILADEVYQMLWYNDRPPDALGMLSESGNVFSLGSFSKILAPGLRLGWIQTSNERVERLTQIGFVSSGGSINHYTSHIVRHAIELGLQQKHLETLCTTFRLRLGAMEAALTEHMSEHATWLRPDGGYFFWLKLNAEINTLELKQKAMEVQVGFQAGEFFSSSGCMKNYMRLCFAHYDEDDIREGVARLGSLFE